MHPVAWTSWPVLVLLTALACAPPPESARLGEGPAVAFVGAMLLDPERGPSGPATLIVQGDRIAAVLAGESASLPERVERVDARGRYLLPGLWDLHTHLALADAHAPPLLVTQGVTGVRDLGAVLAETDDLRARIDSGELLGPRSVRSGPTLNGEQNAPFHRVIDSADSARQAVADLKAAGVDLLKTHNATGREAYFALLEAAAEAELQVVGHVPTSVHPVEACDAGQASIEHIATIFEGTYIASFESEMQAFLGMGSWIENEAPALVECFAEHRTLFVPTLRAYDHRAHRAAEWDEPHPGWRYLTAESYRRWRETSEPDEVDRNPEIIELRDLLVRVGGQLAQRLQTAGAPIGAGTDLGWGSLPGYDLHAEIRLLERSGLTPREALRASTRGPGPAAGGDALQGRLIEGAPADLLLLGADAFEDLAALDAIEGVVLRGDYLDRAALDAVLAGLEGPHP